MSTIDPHAPASEGPTRYLHLADLQALVGHDIGCSQWLAVDQHRIDQFAHATGDHQWIHTDPVRAAAGPFGATVAHGFLTLSLLPSLFETAFAIADVRMGVNYGLNRVRFMSPVHVGSRVRGRFKLVSFEPLPGGAQLTVDATIEIEGADEPACVAQTVSRRYV
jgi:acyl dehydratase